MTTAAAPMPAIHPYRQGSVAPTEAMDTVPLNRLARVNCGNISLPLLVLRRANKPKL